MTGEILIGVGDRAVLESADGFSLALDWDDDGITPGGTAAAPTLRLPVDQEPFSISMSFGQQQDDAATEVFFALDRLSDSLRRFSYTVLEGLSIVVEPPVLGTVQRRLT